MSNNVSFSKIESPYFNKISNSKNNKIKEMMEKYNYFIPKYYFKENNKYNISNYYKTKLILNNIEQVFHQIELLIDINPTLFLEDNKKNYSFDFNNNCLYNNISLNNPSNENILFESKKTDFINNMTKYKDKSYLYTHIKRPIFLKVLEDYLKRDDKYIFDEIYIHFSSLVKKLFKSDVFKMDFMVYEPLFKLRIHDDSNNKNKKNSNKNKMNKIKYILLNNDVNTTNNSQNSQKSQKSIDKLNLSSHYYDTFNYKKEVEQSFDKIRTLYKEYYTIANILDKNNYKNTGELLKYIIKMEFLLVQIIVYLPTQSEQCYLNIFKKDHEIRKYIQRNLLNFNFYKSSMGKSIFNSINANQNTLLKINDFSIDSFFNKNN